MSERTLEQFLAELRRKRVEALCLQCELPPDVIDILRQRGLDALIRQDIADIDRYLADLKADVSE